MLTYLDGDPDDDRRNGADDPDDEVVDERSTLLEYLRVYRLTLKMKCADLDADQLARRSVPPSTMSLLGLLRHMAGVEHNWFQRVMAGEQIPRLYVTEDDRDADWNGAAAGPEVVAEAWTAWRREVAFAEELAAATSDLGTRGHADLLRERIDGRVGQ